MAYKEYGATIAPSNVSSTGFPIAMGTHIGGGRIVNDKSTLNLKHWCLLGEGVTLNDQKANAIGQVWYDTSDSKYWKLDSWSGTHPVWVDVSTIFATRSYVDDAINDIPDPMIFKGSLGTGGTITSLPTASSSNTGFTYKVITAGTYAGQVAKAGDTFISDGTTWNLIPSGDEPSGTVTSITLNATSPILIDNSAAITTSGTRTFSHATTSGNKHIPSGGSANQILKWSADGTAVWSDEVNTHYTSKNIVSSSAIGVTNVSATNPYLNHIEESTVTSSHRISGSGATTVSSNATGNITISSTDTDTTYSFATGTSNGTFNVTPSGGTATPVSIYGLGTAAYTASTNYASSSHNHSVFTTTEDGFVPKSVTSNTTDFLRRDGSWATPTGTTYTLPLAASGTRGGIQIGYTESGANIPLLLSSEKGYVTLTSSSITTGLGYTPYNSTNPNGYTTNTGTVTSVDTGTGLSGGPITSTGTINLATAYGDSVNPYASKTAKYVLAAPNVTNGVPSFRALVASDIPILNQNTTGSAGSVTSSITFNNGGAGSASGITYNGSTAFTVSYNTIGAAASDHTHSSYVNQTLTSGSGMAAWTETNGNLTIALGTPSTITESSTNSLTSTSHTHQLNITPASIGASSTSHNHSYWNITDLPNHYNATHENVPSNDFNDLINNYPNNIWLCDADMRNGPKDRTGNIDSHTIGDYTSCVIQQIGDESSNKLAQILYILTGNVNNLLEGDIYYRTKSLSLWTRITDKVNNMVEGSLIGLSTYTNSATANRLQITKSDNITQAYNSNTATQYIHITSNYSSLAECILIFNDTLTTYKYNITWDTSFYKVCGPWIYNQDLTTPVVISIWRNILFINFRT